MSRLLVSRLDAQLATIGGASYLFLPDNQSVLKLNAQAAAVWPLFQKGVFWDIGEGGMHRLRDATGQRLDPSLCPRSVVEGLLTVEAVVPLAVAPTADEDVSPEQLEEDEVVSVATLQFLTAGGVVMCICYEDFALRRELGAAFDHMSFDPFIQGEKAATGAHAWSDLPSSMAVAEWIVVRRRDTPEGEEIGIAEREGETEWAAFGEAAPLLKIAVTETVLCHSDRLLLHGASLRVAPLAAEGAAGAPQDHAMLLIGGPGAGKSTLATALDCAGLTLEGDDLTMLNWDGSVEGVPFPVTLKTGSWDLLQTLFQQAQDDREEELQSAPIFLRQDAQHVRYLALSNGENGPAMPVRWVIFLDREVDQTLDVEPQFQTVEAPSALSELIRSSWSGESALDPDEFQALASCLDGAACLRLRYRDLDSAVAALLQLAGAPGRCPVLEPEE